VFRTAAVIPHPYIRVEEHKSTRELLIRDAIEVLTAASCLEIGRLVSNWQVSDSSSREVLPNLSDVPLPRVDALLKKGAQFGEAVVRFKPHVPLTSRIWSREHPVDHKAMKLRKLIQQRFE
jgi:hypothetical protein